MCNCMPSVCLSYSLRLIYKYVYNDWHEIDDQSVSPFLMTGMRWAEKCSAKADAFGYT